MPQRILSEHEWNSMDLPCIRRGILLSTILAIAFAVSLRIVGTSSLSSPSSELIRSVAVLAAPLITSVIGFWSGGLGTGLSSILTLSAISRSLDPFLGTLLALALLAIYIVRFRSRDPLVEGLLWGKRYYTPVFTAMTVSSLFSLLAGLDSISSLVLLGSSLILGLYMSPFASSPLKALVGGALLGIPLLGSIIGVLLAHSPLPLPQYDREGVRLGRALAVRGASSSSRRLAEGLPLICVSGPALAVAIRRVLMVGSWKKTPFATHLTVSFTRGESTLDLVEKRLSEASGAIVAGGSASIALGVSTPEPVLRAAIRLVASYAHETSVPLVLDLCGIQLEGLQSVVADALNMGGVVILRLCSVPPKGLTERFTGPGALRVACSIGDLELVRWASEAVLGISPTASSTDALRSLMVRNVCVASELGAGPGLFVPYNK